MLKDEDACCFLPERALTNPWEMAVKHLQVQLIYV